MSSRDIDPIRPTDAAARALARELIEAARFAALAVIEPGGGAPMVTRIAVGTGPEGTPVALISSLALHTMALRAEPACSLLLGEPGAKGDPLSHPRLTLQARAVFVAPDDPARARLRADWLRDHPKAKLYVDFADFGFVRFEMRRGYLNGGFGRAFHLTAEDLARQPG